MTIIPVPLEKGASVQLSWGNPKGGGFTKNKPMKHFKIRTLII
jgi:hypothetical protein